MSRQTLLFALMFIASLSAYQWLASDEEQLRPQVLLDRPSITANNIYIISYDETGRVRYRVRAEYMDYFTEQDESHLQDPLIYVYPDPKQPIWQITSEQATVQQRQSVAFENQVVVKNLSRGEYMQDLHTEWLEVDLQTETIYSDRPVRMNGLSHHIDGLGLYGDLSKETVTLLDEIEAVYIPQS